MHTRTISRRALLACVSQISLAGAALYLGACGRQQPSTACVDSEQLTDAESSLRSSVQYTDQAPDPAKACSGCAYFHAAANAVGCGHCQILNGPVSASGHCTSWSQRA